VTVMIVISTNSGSLVSEPLVPTGSATRGPTRVYGVFTADRAALVAQDLGLTALGIDDVVQEHGKFFIATKRVQSLKALLSPEDDATDLRAKMTAVLLGLKDSHSLLEISRALLVENAKGQRTKYDASSTTASTTSTGVARIYGYDASSPSIEDLVLWICRKAIEGFNSDQPGGLQNVQLSSSAGPVIRSVWDSFVVMCVSLRT
jgi:hypothetical protein